MEELELLLSIIKEKGAQKSRLEEEEKQRAIEYRQRKINEIINLKDRILNIIKIEKNIIKNNLREPNYITFGLLVPIPEKFIADPIRHTLGFITQSGQETYGRVILGIGCHGGGCCKWETIGIDNQGEFIDDNGKDSMIAINNFVKDFEKFEKEYYEDLKQFLA